MANKHPDWMLAAVAGGLQRLVALALPGQPPAETIVLTAAAWCDALLQLPVEWEINQDLPRLEKAFSALLPLVEKWPVPKRLIAELPDRPAPLALPKPAIPKNKQVKVDEAKIQAIIAEIKAKRPVPRAGRPMSESEERARLHQLSQQFQELKGG